MKTVQLTVSWRSTQYNVASEMLRKYPSTRLTSGSIAVETINLPSQNVQVWTDKAFNADRTMAQAIATRVAYVPHVLLLSLTSSVRQTKPKSGNVIPFACLLYWELFTGCL